jgi:hypothetical protein
LRRKGEFLIDETMMLGNPQEKSEELRKVLGLRWYTEREEILVALELNYVEETKEASAE